MAELWFGCLEYYHACRSGNTFNECLCVVLGAKSMAHWMKFHLLQWEVVKVKLLMNSNLTLTVLNLNQKTDPKVQQDFKGQGHYDKVKSRLHHDAANLQPLTNVPTKYQLPTPYGFRDIALTRFYRSRSLWQGQRSNQGQTMTLQPTPPNQCSYQVSTSYTLQFPRYSLDKIL